MTANNTTTKRSHLDCAQVAPMNTEIGTHMFTAKGNTTATDQPPDAATRREVQLLQHALGGVEDPVVELKRLVDVLSAERDRLLAAPDTEVVALSGEVREAIGRVEAAQAAVRQQSAEEGQ